MTKHFDFGALVREAQQWVAAERFVKAAFDKPDLCDWCATEACTSGTDVCHDALREADDALRGESAGDELIEQENR